MRFFSLPELSEVVSGILQQLNILKHKSTLPPQTGNAGDVLITNGTTPTWVSPTSVGNTNASILTTGTLPDARLSNNVALKSGLATVATTGVYNDLSGKPDVTLNLTPTVIKTSAYSAAAFDLVRTDTTNGVVVVTLPTGLPNKSRVAVKMVTQGGTNATTINLSGSDVFNKTGGATSASLLLLNQTITFQYDSAGIWTAISSDTPISQLDLRYRILPINSRIAFDGDSITNYGYGISGTTETYGNYGFTTWAMTANGGYFFAPVGSNKGVSGQTSTQVRARFGATLDLQPKIMTLLIGTNDLAASVSAATIIDNLDYLYKAAQGVGSIVIAITILPRFGAKVLTTQQEADRVTVNTWIKTQASTTLIVIDGGNVLPTSNLYWDGLHPNNAGAFILGNAVAVELNKFSTGAKVLDSIPIDSSGVPNYYLTGTSGSLTTATGQVATSCTLRGNNSGGATVVGAKVVSGFREFQRITISGTTSSLQFPLSDFYQDGNVTYYEGETIEGVIEYEILNSTLTNIQAVTGALTINTAAGTINTGQHDAPNANELIGRGAGVYIVKTPPLKISGGQPNLVRISVSIKFMDATGTTLPVAADILVKRMVIRRVSQFDLVKSTQFLTTQKRRRAIADVAATLSILDYKLSYTTLTATRAITLPTAASAKDLSFVIKDEAGTAGTNNLTIVGTVNGVVNPTAINTNYGVYRFYSNGAAWFSE